MEAFIFGFYELIPYKYLKIMNVKEFGLILSGIRDIDGKYTFILIKVDEMMNFASFDGY